MTPEEMQTLADRLDQARKAEGRVSRLADAVKKLNEEAVAAIQLDFKGDNPIEYRPAMGSNFTRVCWSREEVGLGAEIREAVLAVVQKRLEDARREYEAI